MPHSRDSSPSTTLEQVERLSGQDVERCYQCEKCSVGCPVADVTDLMPHQVAQLLALGQAHEVLTSSMVWLCVGCETCGQRCPNQVNLGRVMDALKQLTRRHGLAPREKAIAAFHRAFLDNLEAHGRIHEATMLASYKLHSRDLLSDLSLGARLFLKGKIPLRPVKEEGVENAKALFRRAIESSTEGDGE